MAPLQGASLSANSIPRVVPKPDKPGLQYVTLSASVPRLSIKLDVFNLFSNFIMQIFDAFLILPPFFTELLIPIYFKYNALLTSE